MKLTCSVVSYSLLSQWVRCGVCVNRQVLFELTFLLHSILFNIHSFFEDKLINM